MEFNNPKYFGPGVWWCIHKIALHGDKTKKYNETLEILIMLLKNLPCNNCRIHSIEHMNKHQPFEYLNSHESPLFYWTYIMHNKLNKYLKKKELTYDEAYKLHTDEACVNCGGISQTEESLQGGKTGKDFKFIRR